MRTKFNYQDKLSATEMLVYKKGYRDILLITTISYIYLIKLLFDMEP